MTESTLPSEKPPEDSEPATGPVLTPPLPPGPAFAPMRPPQPVYVGESSRLNKAAAWVGIVAGSLFIVVVIFGSGFVIGKQVGHGPRGQHGGGHGGGHEMMMRPGSGMPMGPRGEFERRPGFSGPFGPGGTVIEIPRAPGGPGGSGATPTPPRP